MSFEDVKLQFYMAADWDEYKRALKIAQEDERVIDIKEVGEMETTNWDGDRMFVYVFVMSAPNGFMRELCDFMKVKTTYI